MSGGALLLAGMSQRIQVLAANCRSCSAYATASETSVDSHERNGVTALAPMARRGRAASPLRGGTRAQLTPGEAGFRASGIVLVAPRSPHQRRNGEWRASPARHPSDGARW